MIVIKPVNNSVVDVFYGEYGFDSREHTRFVFNKKTNAWNIVLNKWESNKYPSKVYKAEIEFGCITSLDKAMPSIITALTYYKKLL